MKTTLILAFAAVVALPSVVAAAPGASDGRSEEQIGAEVDTQAEQAPPEEERKICRTDKTTGSLTRRRRICMTETQWRELHDRTRRGLNEMTSAAAGGKQCVQDAGGGCR